MIQNNQPESEKPIYLPTFVETLPASKPGDGPRIISHWSPQKSGITAVDEMSGINYCLEAIKFARQIRAPYFLVCVLKQMRRTEIGIIETAFLNQLCSKAIAGGRGPFMPDSEAIALSQIHGCEISIIREIEGWAQYLILKANNSRQPEILWELLVEWFAAPDTWIAEVVGLVICGAALKGGMN